jgi:hypothetical protein
VTPEKADFQAFWIGVRHPVTPEVAGSSPVAPVRSGRPHPASSSYFRFGDHLAPDRLDAVRRRQVATGGRPPLLRAQGCHAGRAVRR